MWKTTDRYVQQKRLKAADAESKLKQVYIPNYTKPNPAIINNSSKGIMNGSSNGNGNEIATINGGKPCESCSGITSTQVKDISLSLIHHPLPTHSFTIPFSDHDLETLNTKLKISFSFSLQWYSWGPTHMNCRICHSCWTYWKKYGGLKAASRLADSDIEMVKKKSDVDDGTNDLLNRPSHR